MDIYHVTLTAEREARLPLFPDAGTYLEALHRIGAVCGGCLALFALIAEHLHLVALLSRAQAGRLAQAISLTLRPIVATPFAPSHIRSVDSRSHMRWLLRYILEQPREHGMPGHPALWIGSCFPDLVGARLIEGLSLCIERALPDYHPAAALRIVGLPGTDLGVPDRATLRSAGANRLKLATAAALGIASLEGNTPAAVRARRSFAQLADRIDLHRAETVAALQIRRQSAWRLMRSGAERADLVAIARRVELEKLVQEELLCAPPSGSAFEPLAKRPASSGSPLASGDRRPPHLGGDPVTARVR
jgi:hypothetical protein